jgi:hypothetical protein
MFRSGTSNIFVGIPICLKCIHWVGIPSHNFHFNVIWALNWPKILELNYLIITWLINQLHEMCGLR